MPDAMNASSSLRLSDDLRRIREERGLTLDELHEETKIPVGLLEQFEATGLFDHPMFNRVYLRSLVRAYAGIIGISTDEALAALDEALAGTYEGGLAVEYLGEAVPVGEEPARETGPVVEELDQEQEAPLPEAKTPPHVPPAPEDPEALRRQEQVQEAGPRRVEPRRRPVAPPVETPSWESQSPPPVSRRTEPVDIKQRAWHTQWIFIGLAIIVLAGAIWGVLALIGGPDGETGEQVVVTADTSAVDTPGAQQAPPAARVTLGDTVHVVVVAARDKVDPIRITRDDDLRRPYWIERGSARQFAVLQRVVLEGNLGNIRLLVEGYEYPTNRRDEQGRIVITRADAQAFLNEVEGPPVNLQAALEAARPSQ